MMTDGQTCRQADTGIQHSIDVKTLERKIFFLNVKKR